MLSGWVALAGFVLGMLWYDRRNRRQVAAKALDKLFEIGNRISEEAGPLTAEDVDRAVQEYRAEKRRTEEKVTVAAEPKPPGNKAQSGKRKKRRR